MSRLPTNHLSTLPSALTDPTQDRLNEVGSGALNGATGGLALGGAAVGAGSLGMRQFNSLARRVPAGPRGGGSGGRLGKLMSLLGGAGAVYGAHKGWGQADKNYTKGLQNVRAIDPRQKAADARAMTEQEQFKLGFLARCAEEGLSEVDIEARVKAADWLDNFANIPSSIYNAAGNAASGAYNAGNKAVADAARFTTRNVENAVTGVSNAWNKNVVQPAADVSKWVNEAPTHFSKNVGRIQNAVASPFTTDPKQPTFLNHFGNAARSNYSGAAPKSLAPPKIPTPQIKSSASLADMATGLATGAGNFILKAPAVAALGAVGGAGLLGAGAGYLHRKSELAKPVDTEDIQKQELILAYMQHRQKILNDMKRNNGGNRNMQLEEGF